MKEHSLVRLSPTNASRRRGEVMKGARLPALAASTGPGCSRVWYRVHDDSWICGEDVKASRLPPSAPRYPIVKDGELTPWPYGFVREPTVEYRLEGGGYLSEVRDVLEGFGFGVDGAVSVGGQAFYRTAEGNLVPRGAVGITGRVSELAGVALVDGKPWPMGFVNSKVASTYMKPSRRTADRLGKAQRFTPFQVLEETGEGRKRFVRFDENAWIAGSDVRVSTAAPPPEGLGPGQRWIDVDTEEQIVTAYEGATPVYVTLISSGRRGPSSTIKGTFRIWVKVAAIAMDNTDEPEETGPADGGPDAGEAPKLFSLHDVPWTQFFYENFALHGVYWHNGFGNRRSHGCVNLSPRDAKWFYEWTLPRVPDGFWAVHTSPNEQGTLVRVR
ncbi:MAG: L,D-transpeptidase [Deltaproteobacteria bacterium]|nr:L,D-transpeptidase [Deltaproteobacteria bacterium]